MRTMHQRCGGHADDQPQICAALMWLSNLLRNAASLVLGLLSLPSRLAENALL